MPFLVGPAPIRRTLPYLNSGFLMLKERVSIIEVHYNMFWRKDNHPQFSMNYDRPNVRPEDPMEAEARIRERAGLKSPREFRKGRTTAKLQLGPRVISKVDNHTGMREFWFWEIPRLQYQNPNVQIVRFLEMSPLPFLRVWVDEGKQDVLFDGDNKDRKSILEQLVKTLGIPREEQEKIRRKKLQENEAIFGFNRRYYCACELPDQVPCPGLIPLPMRMQGKFIKYKQEELEAWENDLDREYPTEAEIMKERVAFPVKHPPQIQKVPGLEKMYMRKPQQQTRPFKMPEVIVKEFDAKRLDRESDQKLFDEHQPK